MNDSLPWRKPLFLFQHPWLTASLCPDKGKKRVWSFLFALSLSFSIKSAQFQFTLEYRSYTCSIPKYPVRERPRHFVTNNFVLRLRAKKPFIEQVWRAINLHANLTFEKIEYDRPVKFECFTCSPTWSIITSMDNISGIIWARNFLCEGFEAMKKNLYKFWTQLANAVSDTDFVNRDLSKNYAIFILFLSSSPWSKLRPHGVVGNGNNVKTNWRFHTNRAIPVQQTSTPCFFILALTCLQWEDLLLAEPFAAVQHYL